MEPLRKLGELRLFDVEESEQWECVRREQIQERYNKQRKKRRASDFAAYTTRYATR